MRRSLARFVFVTLLGTLATVLGIVASMTLTPPGRDLLARTVSRALDDAVHGEITIGSISGSFLYDLTLEDVVVRDSFGVLLARVPRLKVGYRLPNLLRGDVVLSGIQLDEPVIQLIKYRTGRMNYEVVFGLGGPGGGGPPPLVELRDARIRGGTVRLELPWNPAPSIGTQDARDSALAAERARPGRSIVESNQGLVRVITFHRVSAAFSRILISSPDRQPVTLDIAGLATRVSDPAVTLTDAEGRVRIRGDSVVFSLSRAALPNSVLAGGGAVTWPQDTVLFDFQFVAPEVDLRDLRWISSDFPAMAGHGVVAARSVTGARTQYVLTDLHFQRGAQRLDGNLVAITDKRRGLGFRNLDVRLRDLDLAVVHAYLDSLPFRGTLSGTVRGNGWLDSMDVAVNWRYADAEVPGRPVTTLVGEGTVLVKDETGLVFRDVTVRRSDVALGTVQRLAPAVGLQGRLAATGRLNGPLRDVTFTGLAEHRDGQRPLSAIDGLVHLDTRGDTLGVDADVVLQPLSFAGIRGSYPDIPTLGELRGPVELHGTLADLEVDADVAGDLGRLRARGRVTLLPPYYAADSLDLAFGGLDLAALRGTGPTTRLNGALTVTGSRDSVAPPEGSLRLALADSRVREWAIDTLFTDLAVENSVVRMDTLYADWQGARVVGSGALGWERPVSGRMQLRLVADSLTAFDSLALAVLDLRRDTTALEPLNGVATATVTLEGSLDTLRVGADFLAQNLVFQDYRAPELAGSLEYSGGTTPRFTAALSADTVLIGTRALSDVTANAAGTPDSLDWSVGTTIGAQSRVDATGAYAALDGRRRIRVDSLAARLASHRWRLRDSATIVLSDSAPQALSPVELVAVDGSGAIRVEGALPGEAAGQLAIDAVGVDLQDVYALLQLDTAAVAGSVGLNLTVGGTAEAPTFRGTGRIANARFGESRMPYAQAVVDYADRRLDANLLLWKTGQPILRVEAKLPIDLALTDVDDRQVEGPLSVRATGDSVDLAILEAVTPAVERVSGTVDVDVAIGGTWQAPRLDGYIDVNDGALSLPGLGVHYGSIAGRLVHEGDSISFRDFHITSGGGRLDVAGAIRLENLSRPILGLDLQAQRFEVIDDPSFLSLTASGRMQIRGPFFQAVATGQLTANQGVLYFTDLLNKNVVNLDDPTIADLVDTTVIRRRGLGAQVQNRFLDSLRVENLQVAVAQDFWLRSSEANVQLEGRVRASKVRDEYRVEGTFRAPRGSYALKIGPVTRDFQVQRGEVRYFGPATNPEVDISARYEVVAANNTVVPVIANITGTLRQPRLQLSSTRQPPLPEVDLVSYLILGVPAAQASAGQRDVVTNAATSIFSSAVSSELERALISDLGVPVDLIEIRTAAASAGTGQGVNQLVAGWQIGRKVFFTLSAGVCGGDVTAFSQKNLGAGLELRFSREWRAQLSVEPTFQTCRLQTIGGTDITTNYQVGFDILWDREF